jgi:hypothetical protein
MVKDGESRVAELADNLDAMKFERDGALSLAIFLIACSLNFR